MVKIEIIALAALLCIGGLIMVTAGADFSQQEVTAETVLQELNGIKDDSYSVDLTGLNSPRSGMERIDVYPNDDGYLVNIGVRRMII